MVSELSTLNYTKRRDGDSNPGYAFDVYTLSRRASSATRASLHWQKRNLCVTLHVFGYKNIFFFEHYHTILQKVLSKVGFFDYLHIVSALYSRKNALYIVIGDVFHLLNRYIIYIGKFAGYFRHIGGLVPLAPIGYGGEVWGIGL